MHLIKAIIRKSQMSLFDWKPEKHEEQRTVHATTRHLQSGAVVQVQEHQRKTMVSMDTMVHEARRWKGAAMNADEDHGSDNKARLKHSRMTTKADLDNYLMRKFGIDETTARDVSNHLTQNNISADRSAEPHEFAGEPWADAVISKRRTEVTDLPAPTGAQTIVHRMHLAKERFDEALMTMAGITKEQAQRVTQYYLDKKLATMDAAVGHINVKHGAYLDKEVILNAVKETDPLGVKWSKEKGTTTARIDFPESSKEKHHVKAQLIPERSSRGNYAYGATEYWKDKSTGKMKSILLLAGATAHTEEEARADIEDQLRKWSEERNRPATKNPSWHQNADLRRSFAHPVSLIKSRKLDGKINFNGLDISIETGKSRIRAWHDPHNGTSGMTLMKHPYGYIKGIDGTDGDELDVYVGPDRQAANVYIVNQMKAPDFTEHDEQKCMLGFPTEEAAREAYLKHYDNPRFLGSITTMPFEDFKAKVLSGNYDGKMVKSKQKCSREQAKAIGDKLKVSWDKIPLNEFQSGLCHEHEHDDITQGDPVKTGKIALEHLEEENHYYSKLKAAGLE